MFAGKKSAQIREILISESAWEEMTCLFAPSLKKDALCIILNDGLDMYLSKLKRRKEWENKFTEKFVSSRVIWNEVAAVSTLNKKLRKIKKLFNSI